MCIMAVEFLRTTSDIEPIVKTILDHVDAKMDVTEFPSIQKWERFAARHSIDLQHLHYKHRMPKSPTVVKGAVAPETEL